MHFNLEYTEILIFATNISKNSLQNVLYVLGSDSFKYCTYHSKTFQKFQQNRKVNGVTTTVRWSFT